MWVHVHVYTTKDRLL